MLTRKRFLQAAAAGVLAPADLPLEIASGAFRVRLSAGPRGVFIEHLSPAGTIETRGPLRSGTALLPRGGAWQSSRLPDSGQAEAGGSRLRVTGIELGPESEPFARENWELSVAGDTLTWHIDREFLRDVQLAADRFPAVVLRTVENGRFLDIPGFVDPDMRLNGTKAFPLSVPGAEHYEVLSPNRAQTLRLAPSGAILANAFETGLFSYAKPFADGTSATVAFGVETVDPEKGPAPRSKENRQTQVWTLRLLKDDPLPFDLSLPEASLGGWSRSFAAVHNQWMGWHFGNNPGSVPVLQEMAWFPMIQSLYPHTPSTARALTKELLFFAHSAVESDGYVLPRWGFEGFYRPPWGNMLDQIPQFILAMYFHAVNTGNRDFIREVMPALDRVAHFMLALDRDGDGVFEMTGASGLPDGGRHCDGWFDIVNFGHKDALINAWCVAALDAMAELKAWMGDGASAARFRAAHLRSRAACDRIFWDDSAGLYMDWIDVRERMPESGRRYFYADPNLLAIVFGIADRARSQRILAHMDRRYDALCRQFHLQRDGIWATPANFYPVTQLGDLVDNGELANQRVYPNYENGCSFFHSTGFEIGARGMAGQPVGALETFDRVMRHGYARNRLWAAALKWDTGALISEPLNNALLILWGFTRGCLGVRPSLTGLKLEGECPPALEGARHTFCHLGRDVTVTVRNGKPVA